MLTIRERPRRDGTIGYTAIVRLKKNGEIVHEEAETYSTRADAEKWGKKREGELKCPAAVIRAPSADVALKTLIRSFIERAPNAVVRSRSEFSVLKFLERQDIGHADVRRLTAAILIDHVRSRRAAGAGPSTAANDLTAIATVLTDAQRTLNILVNPDVVQEARRRCRELRLIDKSARRGRRPTPEELNRLDQYFRARDRRSRIPICDLFWFAIETARCENEICRLRWDDLDWQHHTSLLRDARQPMAQDGNHRRFRLTPEAWAILERQPRLSNLIFPFNARSVGEAFTRACRKLCIHGLTLNDMRREATYRLFARGYEAHEVAQYTLNASWPTLSAYTSQLRAVTDRSPG
jgi:integrase